MYFPESEEVPETNDNMERRMALYCSLKLEIAASATIGSDQFVYWDPTTAKKRLAPDVFVRLGVPRAPPGRDGGASGAARGQPRACESSEAADLTADRRPLTPSSARPAPAARSAPCG